MSYTDEDARFDYEQLYGPLCPKHGKDCSLCCKECGREGNAHTSWCHLKDLDLCPVCGEEVYITGSTKDGHLIGSCQDAFSLRQWEQCDPEEGS